MDPYQAVPIAIDIKSIVVAAVVMGLAGFVKLLLSEIFIKRVVLIGLKRLSKSTKNDVDDELVAAVEEALEAEKYNI